MANLSTRTRRDWLIAGSSFAAAFAGAIAIGGSWAHADAKPHVAVLGCGRSLGLFITSGPARLVLVSDGSSSGFANAFSRSRRPGLRRIDVLLVDAGTDSVALASRATQLTNPRLTMAIGDDRGLLDQGLKIEAALDSTRSFLLPGDLECTVDPGPISQPGEDYTGEWAARIQRGPSSMLVVKSPDALPFHAGSTPPSALVIMKGVPSPQEIDAIRPQILVVSSQAMSGSDLRAAIAESTFEVLGYRVFQNENLVFSFRNIGLRIPDEFVSAVEH